MTVALGFVHLQADSVSHGVTWLSGGPGRQPLQQCRLLVMPKGLPAVPSTCGRRPLAISHHGALTMPQKMVDISHSCCKYDIDQDQYSKSRTPEPPATYVGSATSSVAFAEPASASLAPQARWSYEGIWSQRSFWATLPLCFGLLRRCMATASPFFLATSTSDSTFELAYVFSFWAVSSHGFFAWGFRTRSGPHQESFKGSLGLCLLHEIWRNAQHSSLVGRLSPPWSSKAAALASVVFHPLTDVG